MKAKIWKVEFGDNWSKQYVLAKNIQQAISKGRRIHLKETRDNGRSKAIEKLAITGVELIAEGEV